MYYDVPRQSHDSQMILLSGTKEKPQRLTNNKDLPVLDKIKPG